MKCFDWGEITEYERHARMCPPLRLNRYQHRAWFSSNVLILGGGAVKKTGHSRFSRCPPFFVLSTVQMPIIFLHILYFEKN